MSKCYFLCMSVKNSSYQKDDKLVEAFTLCGLEYDPFEDLIVDVKSFNVKAETLQVLPVKVAELPGRWMSLDVKPTASSQGGIFNIVESVGVYNESNFSYSPIDKGSRSKK